MGMISWQFVVIALTVWLSIMGFFAFVVWLNRPVRGVQGAESAPASQRARSEPEHEPRLVHRYTSDAVLLPLSREKDGDRTVIFPKVVD